MLTTRIAAELAALIPAHPGHGVVPADSPLHAWDPLHAGGVVLGVCVAVAIYSRLRRSQRSSD